MHVSATGERKLVPEWGYLRAPNVPSPTEEAAAVHQPQRGGGRLEDSRGTSRVLGRNAGTWLQL